VSAFTLKRNGEKLILKDGKVSCTCCEPDCCMYPANGLGDTYNADDLPDTVYAKWQSRIDGTMAKSGSGYESDTVVIRRNSTNTAWEFYDSDDDATRTIGNCLIRGDGGLTPGNDTVEDRFADCYEVNFGDNVLYPPPGGPPYAMTRISLCEWSRLHEEERFGERWTYTWTLRFYPASQTFGFIYEQVQGEINDSFAESFTKKGSNNSPAGDYEDDIPEGNPDVTITECSP